MVQFHCFARSLPFHWFDLAFFVCCTELEDALEELFTAIGTVTDPDGRLLSTWFQLVPHRTVRVRLSLNVGTFTRTSGSGACLLPDIPDSVAPLVGEVFANPYPLVSVTS